VSDDKLAPRASSGPRSASTTIAPGSTAPTRSAEDQREKLERALAEMLAVDRSRAAEPPRYRRLVGVTSMISIVLVLVVIGSVLALSHFSPKAAGGTAAPSTTASSTPTTTTATGSTTLPRGGNTTGPTAIASLTAASRDPTLIAAIGQGGQPMLLERTAASSFITNPTRTPVVEYIWSASGGAGGLENLVVASSLIELGGTFKKMTPLSLGGTYNSVGFSGPYRGPVLFESVQTVGPLGGQGSMPTPQAREQYVLYDATPYTSARGTLPFLDIASHYVLVGSEIPSNLVAGLTLGQIATALRLPHSQIARAIIGGANDLTAGICTTLSALSQPLPAVCLTAVIQRLETTLPTSPPRG